MNYLCTKVVGTVGLLVTLGVKKRAEAPFGGEDEGRGTASLFQYTNCFTCTCMYTLVFQSDIIELSPNIFLLNLPFHRVLLNWSQFTGHNIDKPTPKRNS